MSTVDIRPRREFAPAVLDQMHCIRHRVFHERLGWDVESREGREADRYDQLDPLYGISLAGAVSAPFGTARRSVPGVPPAARVVRGCWRLLPTTGPSLLRDVFHPLLHGAPMPESPDVWEATRFCLDVPAAPPAGTDPDDSPAENKPAENGPGGTLGAVRRETALLVVALLEAGFRLDLQKIVAVCDLRFERILARTGLATHRFGPPLRFGVTEAVAGWFAVSLDNLIRARAAAGLDQDPDWAAEALRFGTLG